MKKRVLKRLLPLLFSFCFVFSGFLSVNAFAATNEGPFYIDGLDSLYFNTGSNLSFKAYNANGGIVNSSALTYKTSASGDYFVHFYDMNISGYLNNVYKVDVGLDDAWCIPALVTSLYDYYLVGVMHSFNTNTSQFTFVPDSMYVTFNDCYATHSHSLTDIKTSHFDTGGCIGFVCSGKLPDGCNSSMINHIGYGLSNGGTLPDCSISFYYLPILKSMSNEQINNVVSAIHSQTETLQNSINHATDDIQQSIEDQYSGDPEEEFSVEDVITQHNEKMGVLSFGSDVMLQFLDMFQSANVGTAELTLPGFNITVENVEYSVWPDYSFNFEQLNEWVPALMSVIRVMLPAFVWLMVLRYCIKVFEDNFLAK